MLQAKNDRTNQKTVYLAFGANEYGLIGQVLDIIYLSYSLLHKKYLTKVEYSPFYQTPAFPEGNGPDYVNSVIKAKTSLGPNELLAAIHSVENQLGRTREQRWGPRVIDIDLLDYDGHILPSLETYNHWRDMPLELQKTTWPEGLILPHPRIQDRGFVLIPLQAVAPDWVHPVTGEGIDTLIGNIPPQELQKIVQISNG